MFVFHSYHCSFICNYKEGLESSEDIPSLGSDANSLPGNEDFVVNPQYIPLDRKDGIVCYRDTQYYL